MYGLLKDYRICTAGSRSDQIPVHVPVLVEAAGEVAAGETCQRYEYWLAEDFGVMAIPTQQT